MNLKFNQNQLRVLGCLIEKSLTTPDQYPLSVNALTNACNQKSNREPVLSLSEFEVQETIDSLVSKQLIMNQSGASSRVQKYKHRFCNTEFGELQFSPQELGIICVLFLRGPQTPGELRTRTNRLCEFTDVHETEAVLTEMASIEAAPFVIKLERLPGKRESRYAHCFCEDSDDFQQAINDSDSSCYSNSESSPSVSKETGTHSSNDRINHLEEQVEMMQLEIDDLREKLEQLLS